MGGRRRMAELTLGRTVEGGRCGGEGLVGTLAS
jgi:hypothetical protein